jgi:membrane protease YdiL (CAAX protease family)
MFWGSTHLFNLIVDPFPVAALQTLETALSGLLYAAFVLYSGSIWPAVFMHWALNASISLQIEQIANYQVPPEAWSTLTLVGMPLLLVAVAFLRRSKPEIESAGETAAVLPTS